jgi:hypothetical protein
VAVGVLAWRVAVHWGPRAGIASGVILAAHPTLTDQRDVRGYSLAVLAIVVMGVAAMDVASPVLFGMALAVGTATHLYAVIAALALMAVLICRRHFGWAWRACSAAGLLVGAMAYAWMLDLLGRHGDHRIFRPTFPRDAAWEWLGRNGVAVALLAALVIVAALRRPSVPLFAGACVLALGVVGPWMLGPRDLYPRFVYFAVPALALAVGAAVHRHAVLLTVACLAAVAMLAPALDTWTRDPLPNRELARRSDDRTCGVGYTVEALRWYLPSVADGTSCRSAAILLPGDVPQAAASARAHWPVRCWVSDRAELRAATSSDCPISKVGPRALRTAGSPRQ